MIEPELSDAADCRRRDHVGGVEPAAKADLDDCRVGGLADESEQRRSRGDLEEAGIDAARCIQHLGEQLRQRNVLDQRAGKADPLVEAHQMRARINMRLEPRRLDRGAEEGAGRALAVGPGDVEDRRQVALRIAEPGEEGGDALQAKHVRARRKRCQTVELALNEGESETA